MSARLYVGTYAKYNSGSIAGEWLDLEDFTGRDSFLAACREVHQDEADPELMFQDYEGFPRAWYSESSAPPNALWEWLGLSDDDKELLDIYQAHVNDSGGEPATIEAAREAFAGKANSEADWAAQFLEDTGGLDGVPAHLQHYIDYEAYARDAQYGGDVTFVRHDGDVWVFHNH